MGWLGDLFGAGDDRRLLFDQINDAPSVLPGMGDIISVEGDCKQGEAAVTQLLAVFDRLGRPAQFSAAVAAIQSSYDDAEGSWTRHVPFSPVCGQIKAIGVQADALSKQMAAALGQVAPTPITQQDSTGAVGKAIGGVVVVGALIAGAIALNASRKG